jgi:hypothetical protein
MAVDGDIGDVGQQLGGAVLPLDLLEQLRRLIDESASCNCRDELGWPMIVFEEGQVGGDAANTELAQRAVHAAWMVSSGVGAQAVTFSSSGS